MFTSLISLIWGLFEATLFFIVPDVWLSLLGMRSLKQAVKGCCFATLGALLGGTIIYVLSLEHLETVNAVFDKIPAICPELRYVVSEQIKANGTMALFQGPFQGIPYKLYASNAATAGIPLITLLIMTVPARFLRFIGVTLAVYGVNRFLRKYFSQTVLYLIGLFGWIVFYGFYFTRMSC